MTPDTVAKHFRTYTTAFAGSVLMIKIFFFIEAFGAYLMDEKSPALYVAIILIMVLLSIAFYIAIFYYMDRFFHKQHGRIPLRDEDVQRLKILGLLIAGITFPQAGLDHILAHITGTSLGNHFIDIIMKFHFITFAVGMFIYASAYVRMGR